MIQAVLWSNLIAFVLMLSGFGMVFLFFYDKHKAPFLSWFLAFQGAMTIWLFAYSYIYFAVFYEGLQSPEVIILFSLLRTLVSILSAVFFQAAVLEYSGIKVTIRTIPFILVAPMLLIPGTVYLVVNPVQSVSNIISGLYWLYLHIFCIYGIVRGRKAITPGEFYFKSFLRFCLILFPILIIDYFFFPLPLPTTPPISTDAAVRAVFGIVWGSIAVFHAVKYRKGLLKQGEKPSQKFIKRHFLTPREAIVLKEVISGLSNSEIAEKLFISEKTVETHLSRVYKKCGVSSRTAVSNKVYKYS
ncbi:MAG: helix-turn-helix domain-containing protein [Spirochaetia bacterium]